MLQCCHFRNPEDLTKVFATSPCFAFWRDYENDKVSQYVFLEQIDRNKKFNLKPEDLRLGRRKNYSASEDVKFRMDY